MRSDWRDVENAVNSGNVRGFAAKGMFVRTPELFDKHQLDTTEKKKLIINQLKLVSENDMSDDEDINYLFSRAETLLSQLNRKEVDFNEIAKNLAELNEQVELYQSTGKLYPKIRKTPSPLPGSRRIIEVETKDKYKDTVIPIEDNDIVENEEEETTIPHIPALRKSRQKNHWQIV